MLTFGAWTSATVAAAVFVARERRPFHVLEASHDVAEFHVTAAANGPNLVIA
jgi:hypothetical protein